MEEVYRALLDTTRSGEPVALVTLVETKGSTPREAGAKMLAYSDGSTVGSIGGGAMEARAISDALAFLSEGESRLVDYSLMGRDGDLGLCGGEVKVFIEIVMPKPTLLIAGAGHISQSLAKLGTLLGFRVVVGDDRRDYATRERFPTVGRVEVVELEELVRDIDITEHCYVVIATRGHEHDEVVLRQVVSTPAAYIGLVGSRRKVAAIFEHLLGEGIPEESLVRVHAPIGLDIGAATLDEIALSIMAEILMIRRGGTGRPLSEQGNPLRASYLE
ncbi:MAG: XdhC/CoxI family protein, partial [Chloroflexota bacterium]